MNTTFLSLKTTDFKSCIPVAVSLTSENKVISKLKCIDPNYCLSVMFLLSYVVLSGGLATIRRTQPIPNRVAPQLLPEGQASLTPHGRPTSLFPYINAQFCSLLFPLP